jgi:hypothetical protein
MAGDTSCTGSTRHQQQSYHILDLRHLYDKTTRTSDEAQSPAQSGRPTHLLFFLLCVSSLDTPVLISEDYLGQEHDGLSRVSLSVSWHRLESQND